MEKKLDEKLDKMFKIVFDKIEQQNEKLISLIEKIASNQQTENIHDIRYKIQTPAKQTHPSPNSDLKKQKLKQLLRRKNNIIKTNNTQRRMSSHTTKMDNTTDNADFNDESDEVNNTDDQLMEADYFNKSSYKPIKLLF